MPRWTPESRQKQAETIRRCRPWTKSTGPTSEEGRARSSRNSWKGGLRASLRHYRDVLRQIEDTTRRVISSFCPKRLSRPARRHQGRPSVLRPAPFVGSQVPLQEASMKLLTLLFGGQSMSVTP